MLHHLASNLISVEFPGVAPRIKVKNGSDMFSGCTNLKGFIDYMNNSEKIDHHYANYKTGYFTKLVGKNGEEMIGAA